MTLNLWFFPVYLVHFPTVALVVSFQVSLFQSRSSVLALKICLWLQGSISPCLLDSHSLSLLSLIVYCVGSSSFCLQLCPYCVPWSKWLCKSSFSRIFRDWFHLHYSWFSYEALQDCFRLLVKKRIRHSSVIHDPLVQLQVNLPPIILLIVSLCY